MTAYVLGVDPSLTGTGCARITQDLDVTLKCFGRPGKRDEPIRRRSERVRDLRAEVTLWARPDWPARPELVAIEAPSHGSAGGSAWDRAHLWWLLAEGLALDSTVQVPPMTRAKWATGFGHAGKAEVAAAMQEMWPGVEIHHKGPGGTTRCPDCSDALCLASIGAARLGWIDTTKTRRDTLNKIVWPTDLEETK